jgi:DNA-binding response OmpR family regulator
MTIASLLWVDDEVEQLRAHILFLEKKGYDVTTINNGADAAELVRERPFDLVLLDEQLPGLSGLDTLERIKELRPSMPVVMVTKSEEEDIMNQAIGRKIADYLIKPVNPSQILLCLKKHIHQQEIVTEQVQQSYRQEWSDITYLIDTASTIEEWQAIERLLSKWDLELAGLEPEQGGHSGMHSLIEDQRTQANAAFAKWISKNYVSIVESRKTASPKDASMIMSPDVMKHAVFPLLDKGEKVLLCVIDNFRYDQWKMIQPLISEFYSIRTEEQYTSILPTATQYARNAIFSGLLPLQIQEMYPQYWVEEGDEDTGNKGVKPDP